MTRHIQLTVTLHCMTTDDDGIPLPVDTEVSDQVAVSFPSMDAKNVVFPKLVEGATESVMMRHQSQVSDYLRQKAEADRERQERRKLDLWNEIADAGATQATAASNGEN